MDLPSVYPPIPQEFINLFKLEIFGLTKSPPSLKPDVLWKQLASWAHFPLGPNIRRRFRNHCRCLWSKVKHAYEVKTQKTSLEYDAIPASIERSSKDKQHITKDTTELVAYDINLTGYYHVLNPESFKNARGEMMVDFFPLNEPLVARDAHLAVDQYYNHTLNNRVHQSKSFKKEFVEHFGSFTANNNEPYTTANTVASHSPHHQKCVHHLIQALQPLSDSINVHFQNIYPDLYSKLVNLDLGPNVPKSFKAFPSVAINFNRISEFHRDVKDHPNTLCVVCPLGTFEGGQLVFPELKLTIHAKQGQAIAFRSHILVHGNLPVLNGVRHSVVFFVHSTVIKEKRKFGSLFSNYELNADTDTLSKKSQHKKAKLSIKNSHIDLHPKSTKSHLQKKSVPSQLKLKNTRSSRLSQYKSFLFNLLYCIILILNQ